MSRRFVAATEAALADLLAADLSTPDLLAIMVHRVHFGEHCCVVALGVGMDGTKHPLARVEGSTDNATLGPARRPAGTRPGRHPADPGRLHRSSPGVVVGPG